MPTDMPRCETCRFWHGDYRQSANMPVSADLLPPNAFGFCDLPTADMVLQDYRMILIGGKVPDIATRSDFGCIAHEPKEG